MLVLIAIGKSITATRKPTPNNRFLNWAYRCPLKPKSALEKSLDRRIIHFQAFFAQLPGSIRKSRRRPLAKAYWGVPYGLRMAQDAGSESVKRAVIPFWLSPMPWIPILKMASQGKRQMPFKMAMSFYARNRMTPLLTKPAKHSAATRGLFLSLAAGTSQLPRQRKRLAERQLSERSRNQDAYATG